MKGKEEKRKKKINNKRERGITLIALVITIIVLLILAGVSIAMITGDNGILTQAQIAKEDTEKASVIERAQLDILAKQTDGKQIYKEDIRQILDKYFSNVINDFTLDTELQTRPNYGDYTIKVLEIYNGELIEKPKLAGEVLIPNENGTTSKEISPYVKYNSMLCRVLYNDAIHGLQIVSLSSVEDVTLGGNSFNEAMTSYNNLVDTLNNKAKEYKGTKAIDARCLGSNAILGADGRFQADISGWYNGESYLDNYQFKDADDNYEEDVNKVNALTLELPSYIWLASREVDANNSNITYFMARLKVAKDVHSSNYFCYVNFKGRTDEGRTTNGICPVILLPYDIIISDGDGSENNPYIIE